MALTPADVQKIAAKYLTSGRARDEHDPRGKDGHDQQAGSSVTDARRRRCRARNENTLMVAAQSRRGLAFALAMIGFAQIGRCASGRPQQASRRLRRRAVRLSDDSYARRCRTVSSSSVVENHALPLVAVRAVIEGGPLLDPAGKDGLFALDTIVPPRRHCVDERRSVGRRDWRARSADRADALHHGDGPVRPVARDHGRHAHASELSRRRRRSSKGGLRRRRCSAPRASRPRPRCGSSIVGCSATTHPFARVATQASVGTITRDDLVALSRPKRAAAECHPDHRRRRVGRQRDPGGDEGVRWMEAHWPARRVQRACRAAGATDDHLPVRSSRFAAEHSLCRPSRPDARCVGLRTRSS